MNMLSRALYGDVAWEESLKNTLAAPSLKVAFRRSDRGQAVSYRRHCGSACALGGTPRIYTRGKYSWCYREGERRLPKHV